MPSLPIGGFTPIPLAIMIPFMGFQSAVIGESFGLMYQYGKRKISAMSNEEFNKLTPQMLHGIIENDMKVALPQYDRMMVEMRAFQSDLVREFIQLIKQLPTDVVGGLQATDSQAFKNLGGNIEGGLKGGEAVLTAIANFFNSFANIPYAEGRLSQSSQEAQRSDIRTSSPVQVSSDEPAPIMTNPQQLAREIQEAKVRKAEFKAKLAANTAAATERARLKATKDMNIRQQLVQVGLHADNSVLWAREQNALFAFHTKMTNTDKAIALNTYWLSRQKTSAGGAGLRSNIQRFKQEKLKLVSDLERIIGRPYLSKYSLWLRLGGGNPI